MFRNGLRFFLILIWGLSAISVSAQVNIADSTTEFTLVNDKVFVLEDKDGTLSINDVIASPSFEKSGTNGSYGLSHSTFWFRIPVTNYTAKRNYVIGVADGAMDSVALYKQSSGGTITVQKIPNIANEFNSPRPIFEVPVTPGSTDSFYLKIKSTKPLSVPLYISTLDAAINDNTTNNTIFGVYLGIALIMFFYNFFIYLTTRDKVYRDYIVYILFLVLTQVCLQGYINFIIGDELPYLTSISVPIATAMVGITSMIFIKHFLNLKANLKWAYHVINIQLGIHGLALVLTFGGFLLTAQNIIQVNTLIAILISLTAGVRIQRGGFRSAVYFNISWSFFLLSVVIWIMKDTGVLPFNALTNSSILIGSSLAILLLSFALADKINTYKKEKEESQALALSASLENERIVREQNVILEQKVTERTVELKKSNLELATTLQELKDAEAQLVESEKMASLGQLTAGIAHEINNPINFVTSNVSPLKRDVNMLIDMIADIESISATDDSKEQKLKKISALKTDLDYDYLKTEIDYLLKGITEGASRTAEIVKGLRIFSRLDEDDLKNADLNEGLDSTAVIINNMLDNRIVLDKKYSGIPMVECYPGKLNQVFLNIMTNGIYAINKRWGTQPGGVLTLSTRNDENNVYVTIADNGTGMDEQTKKKLFEPFFTTKDVGEGTGLGLSIAYNTLRKHNGFIDVVSTLGEGTQFIMTLPLKQ